MAEWVKCCKAGEIPKGRMMGVAVGGLQLCIANVNGSFHAVEDQCSHEDFPLSEGELVGTIVECARHGARFDVKTGQAVRLPATEPVATFEVKVEDNEIYVAV